MTLNEPPHRQRLKPKWVDNIHKGWSAMAIDTNTLNNAAGD